MDTTNVNSMVEVKHCFRCQETTEYYCHYCKGDLCCQCKNEHCTNLDTFDHNTVLYREKYGDPLGKCRDQNLNQFCLKHHDHILEMYCESCDLPICFKCREHSKHKILKMVRKVVRKQNFEEVLERFARRSVLSLESETSRFFQLQERTTYIPPHKQNAMAVKGNTEDLIMFLREINKHAKEKLQLMTSPTFEKTLKVFDTRWSKGITCISCVTQNFIWISNAGNVMLINERTGKRLMHLDTFHRFFGGSHTLNSKGELFYIDMHNTISKLSEDLSTTTRFMKRTDSEWINCLYCSPITGDLLIGICQNDKRPADYRRFLKMNMFLFHKMHHVQQNPEVCNITRCNNTGKITQTIQYDNEGRALFALACFITENNNGDVVVSDIGNKALVVTDCGGMHRFSYTGRPSGYRLRPLGICTDSLSNILVCDGNTNSVHMLNENGTFLCYLLTKTSYMKEALCSLFYDVNTHLLWIGSAIHNTISVYRYIRQRLPDEESPQQETSCAACTLGIPTEEYSRRISNKSPDVCDLLTDISDKIHEKYCSLSFVRNLLNTIEVFELLKNIKSLSVNIHLYGNVCINKYPHTPRHGALIVAEVEVVFKNGIFWVMEKNSEVAQTHTQATGNFHPNVVLVTSRFISTIDAKLAVYRKYKDWMNMEKIFIYHEYDYEEIAKLIAFYEVSCFSNKIKSLSMKGQVKSLEGIVILAAKRIDTTFNVPDACYDVIVESDKSSTIIEKTIVKTSEALGHEIYKNIRDDRYKHLFNKLYTYIPASFYEDILRRAMTFVLFEVNVASMTTFSLPVNDNSEEWRTEVANEIGNLFSRKKDAFLMKIKDICTTMQDELSSVDKLLEECKSRCEPKPLNELVKEWENRELLKGSDELKRLPSVLKYVLGRKGDQACVKVFLQNDDENAKSFFNEKKNSLLKNILSDFVIVEECSRRKWNRMKELEKKERMAPKISEKERKKIDDLINDEREKIYAKFSTVVRIEVSNVNTKNSDNVPCIVLYCLDDTLIPFGENPLPSYIGEYPCNIREDIVLFGSCENCPTVNSGCDIGGESFSGSAGFLVKYNNRPAKGFLTAAHVVVNNLDRYYKFSSENFSDTIKPKGRIRHPSNSDTEVGLVDDCLFGNFCSNGFDVAVVCITSPTSESVEPVILPIAEERSLSYLTKLKVIKKGKTTLITTGELHPKSDSVRLSFEMDNSLYYLFQRPYSVKDEDYNKPFFKLGDSGSGVFLMERSNRKLKPIGIAFGRSEFTTHVCQIEDVTDKFHLSIYQDAFVKEVLDHPNDYFKDSDDEVDRDEETMEMEN